MVTNSKILVPENFILRLKIFRDGRNQAFKPSVYQTSSKINGKWEKLDWNVFHIIGIHRELYSKLLIGSDV